MKKYIPIINYHESFHFFLSQGDEKHSILEKNNVK